MIDPPHCASDKFSGFVWPLLIVKNSRWLASGDFDTSVAIAAGTNKEPWQQFTVVTLERSIDIIARGDVSANGLPRKLFRFRLDSSVIARSAATKQSRVAHLTLDCFASLARTPLGERLE